MAQLDLAIRHHPRYRDDALSLARRLFARFDEEIDTLALTPIDEDEFALFVNGRLLHSQREMGSAPRVADVVAARAAGTLSE